MKSFFSFLVAAALFISFSSNLFAVPANPYPITLTQPDGTTLTVRLHGDEFFNYTTTIDGYLIASDTRGFYQYAHIDEAGNYTLAGVRANEVSQRGADEQRFLSAQAAYPDLSERTTSLQRSRMRANEQAFPPIMRYPLSGRPISLVILVDYPDVPFTIQEPQKAFSRLLNEEGYSENGGTGSARDYFRDNSMGVFDPEFIVVGPYTLPEYRSYYGGNAYGGGDQRPDRMVADACALAKEDGVDFAQFDTDDDGVVDNVFVYYAGHNEAEGGPKETIWPHRYGLYYIDTQIDGKRVMDYACTSELRGAQGSSMCGIGTFVHEFGHVLGLPDYYATNGASHATLGYWSAMDAGPYLNAGRTPPAYSAYDRFYLGWMTPTQLTEPIDNVELTNLAESNEAYLLTQSETHNMDGANPEPREFLMFENRQNQGWDKYLPGHGMLVTRIVYRRSQWSNNTVNNTFDSMGYALVQANGFSSAAGEATDPFPGTADITVCEPTLRSGEKIGKNLTNIREEDGVIYFDFMQGYYDPVLNVATAPVPFNIVYTGEADTPQEIKVTGKNLTKEVQLSFEEGTHFEMSLSGDSFAEWTKTLQIDVPQDVKFESSVYVRYAPTEPSYNRLHEDALLIVSEGAENLSIALTGNSKRPVYVTTPVAKAATDITESGFTANWEAVEDATGYYLTVLAIKDGESTKEEGFRDGLSAPAGWTIQGGELATNRGHYGKASPAIQLSAGGYVETEFYSFPVKKLSFLLASVGSSQQVLIEAFDGKEWSTLATVQLSSLYKKTSTYQFETEEYSKFRISYQAATGAVAVDDIAVVFSKEMESVMEREWIEATQKELVNLSAENEYMYRVQASDKAYYPDESIKYENITMLSDPIYVRLITSGVAEDARVGSLNEALARNCEPIYVFDVMGQLIEIIPADAYVGGLKALPADKIYIIKVGEQRFKLLME